MPYTRIAVLQVSSGELLRTLPDFCHTFEFSNDIGRVLAYQSQGLRSMSLGNIVSNASRRMVAVAARDIMPGAVLFSEEPLLVVHDAPPLRNINIRTFDRAFRGMGLSKRKQYLNLLAILSPRILSERAEIAKTPSKNTLDDPLLIALLVYFEHHVEIQCNCCGHIEAVYSTWAHVQHGCGANCYLDTSQKSPPYISHCRATTHIKAGEALYKSDVIDMPMHPKCERRRHFMDTKGFTCHCPRCDSPGDDTRQYECFDGNCAGTHQLHYSINMMDWFAGSPKYDVSFSAPYLLPCSVCQRRPPQNHLFPAQLHEDWCHHAVGRRIDAARGEQSPARLMALYEEVLGLPIQCHPGQMMQAYSAREDMLWRVWEDRTYTPRIDVLQRGLEQDLRTLGLVVATVPGLVQVQQIILEHLKRLTERISVAASVRREVLQKLLRVRKLMLGRQYANAELEKELSEVLCKESVPQEVVDMAVCAFCEESPQRAALTLSKCARCKKVVYCSKGCQKAHWPLHKQRCSNASG